MKDVDVDKIVDAVRARFLCFGKGDGDVSNNPIAAALADRPPMFAAGVDVKEVVEFVLEQASK